MSQGSGPRRVVLVGFMASGKSTVGRIVAQELGWRFVDVDTLIEHQEGASIPEIFRDRGERHFRAVEERLTRELLGEDRVVLASGGGWAARPGRLRDLPRGTVSVWLRVTPEEAVRRAGQRSSARPLLAVEDPVRTAGDLLAAREACYREADIEMDTGRQKPEDVAAAIVTWVTGRQANNGAV